MAGCAFSVSGRTANGTAANWRAPTTRSCWATWGRNPTSMWISRIRSSGSPTLRSRNISPPDGKVNYGPPVDGLSAALELETRNGEVMAGETIGARLFIRNTADYDIQVRSPFWREGDEASVVDEAGRPIKTRDVSGSRDLTVQRKTLKPGEVLTVDSRGLVFVLAESGDDQTNYPGDYSALVTPGKYTVNFVLRFGDAVTAAWIPYITPGQPPPLANLPEPLDW